MARAQPDEQARPADPPAEKPVEKTTEKPAERKVPHGSHWGAFRAVVRGGRLVAAEPFEEDPSPSPILRSLPGTVHGESRVERPMVREGWLERGPGGRREARGGEPFVPVDWALALDLVADELRRVKEEHGNEAIFAGSYGWGSAGRLHNAKNLLHRFLNLHGGFTGQKFTYSIAAGYAILPHVVGTASVCSGPVTTWDGIIASTRLFVMFGGLPLKNTQVASGGAGTHPTGDLLRRARAAGVEFVHISPLRSDAPGFLDAQWIAPRPNTDTALMLGLAHTLAAEGLHDRDFLARYCTGYEKFEAYLLGKTDGRPKDAAWAEGVSEVPAGAIRALARRMAAARTLISTNWSLQRGDHGEQPFWMTVALAAMLGQIGLPGGGFGFGYGSMGGMGLPRAEAPAPTLPAGENPTGSFIPVARITDMLLNPGGRYAFNGEERVYPEARLIYWCGGNPFHHHQDLNRLLAAWKRPDTVIVHEPWWTASARHADIVLPATTSLERNDIGASPRDRFLIAMHRAIDPVGAARNDFDIFAALADRLGFGGAFTEGRGEMDWLRRIYASAREAAATKGFAYPPFEAFWERGHFEMPAPEKPFVLFEEFRRDPARHPLRTPSGRIEIFSETVAGFGYEDCPGHPAWLEPAEWLGAGAARRHPLHLVSNQPRTRLHSQLDGGALSRAEKIHGREPLRIHPADAAARGIADGSVVRVFNDRGEVLAGAALSEEVRPGVVQLATGAWYDPIEPGRPGALDKHGNPNVLTLDKGTSRLGQGPVAHSALVEVAPFAGPLPEVTAFRPPATAEA